VSNLFRLQILDSQLDSQKARLAEIDVLLNRHPELDQARAMETETRALLEKARRELRQAEEETKRQQLHIQESEKALYGGSVQNPKELKDLQEEVSSLRRYLSTLEDRQLQSMMACEEAEKSLSVASQKVSELEKARSESEATLKKEAGALQSTMRTLDVQREAAVSAIEAADLEKYLELRKIKRGLAVARMEGGSCAACGVEPSSARIDSARSGQDIIQCGNCGRILYLG
jgi:predicted  nucleic acid-binding Zn-ribbon protein